jgi:hypothetical protein
MQKTQFSLGAILLLNRRTRADDFEGRADYVVSVVFDADVVVAGHERRVAHFVALLHLGAVHAHLGRAVDRHGQGAHTGVARIDDEVRLLT